MVYKEGAKRGACASKKRNTNEIVIRRIMKIKLKTNEGKEIILDASATLTGTTPYGTGFYSIVYQYQGDTVYRVSSGATSTPPSPIEALDWTRQVFVEGDFDGASNFTINDKKVRGGYVTKKNRDILLSNLELVVI
jgi:hypothetical protein